MKFLLFSQKKAKKKRNAEWRF